MECNEVFADSASIVWLILVILSPKYLLSPDRLIFDYAKCIPNLGQDGR